MITGGLPSPAQIERSPNSAKLGTVRRVLGTPRISVENRAGRAPNPPKISRRFDHMQQHTGQHLLSAVFEEHLGLHTVSFHLGAESSTIDLEGGALDAAAAARAERRANQLIS